MEQIIAAVYISIGEKSDVSTLDDNFGLPGVFVSVLSSQMDLTHEVDVRSYHSKELAVVYVADSGLSDILRWVEANPLRFGKINGARARNI